jgi:4-hydroxybenzoate polyprenyltransferase
MPPDVLRLAYIAEFFLVLIAVLIGWSQIGGQGHLDLMPWYDKFILSVSLSLVVVMGTVAAVRQERGWNGKSITCLIGSLLIVAGMAAITYYYHVHEEDEDDDADTATHALLVRPALVPPVLAHRPPGSFRA